MATNKCKGWVRLGIVLSVAWVLGALVFAAYELRSVKTDLTASVRSPDPSLTAGGWEVVGHQSFLTNCEVQDKVASCSPRWDNLAWLTLAPVFAAWVLIVGLTFAVVWIRAGFRGDAT